MMPSFNDPILPSKSRHSPAYRHVAELLASLHPTAWELTQKVERHPDEEKGRSIKTTVITGHSSVERAILKQIRMGWVKNGGTDFAGGWYGTSGNEPILELSPEEARDLFSRVKSHAEDYLKREMQLLIAGNAVDLINRTEKSDWAISRRWTNLEGSDLIGYMAMLKRSIQDANMIYGLSINAVIDVDPSKSNVKVALEKRGFTYESYLIDHEEMDALDAIADIVQLPRFHREEPHLPFRPLTST